MQLLDSNIHNNPISINKPIKNWALHRMNSTSLNDDLNKTNVSQSVKDNEYVTAMIQLTDLELIATGNNAGIIKFWNYEDFSLEHAIDDPKVVKNGKTTGLCYLYDKKSLFCGGEDPTLYKINIGEGIDRWKFESFNNYPNTSNNSSKFKLQGKINEICNSFKNQYLFYNVHNKIACFDKNNNKINSIIEYQKEEIISMVYNESKKLLIYSTSYTINLINPFNSEITFTFETGFSLGNLVNLTSIKQSKDLITGINEDELHFYSIESNGNNSSYEIMKYKTHKYKTKILKTCYCYDDKSILVILLGGIFFLQNMDVEESKSKQTNLNTVFTNGCYFGDGFTIAVTNEDGNVDILGTSKETRTKVAFEI